MYRLVCSYQTGDSFHNEDIDEELIHEFKSKEVAIAAMNRLQEHYKWYSDKESWRPTNKFPEPEWHKELEYDFQASYYLDNGELFKDNMPYCGYFETLYSLEVKDESTKVEF